MTKITSAQQDFSSMSLNMKRAKTTSSSSPGNGSTVNLGGNGAFVTFTVAEACNAFVTVHVACTSSTDFELKPVILLDGSSHTTSDCPASVGNASGRAVQRSVSSVVALPAGLHTIAAGIFVSSSTSAQVITGAGEVIAIVLGRVTA